MERSIALFFCASIASLAPAIMLLVQAQINPEGFISINCGASDPYTDDTTKIYYETDKEFTESGRSMNVSLAAGPRFLETLRSFPDGIRNCYSLKPEQGENKPYLIRASFCYGNYDGKNQTPTFDLYIDVNKWSTMNSYGYEKREIVYVAQRDVVQVCVVNIGKGVPFISALELRVLNDAYREGSGFQELWWRQNLGSSGSSIRYPADVYDRIWDATIYPKTIPLPTTYTQTLSENNDEYKVPAEVLSTAVDGGDFLEMWFNSLDSLSKWIVYFHFADIERLPSGQQRELTISTNNNQFTRKVSLKYLMPQTVVSDQVSGSGVNFSIEPTGSQSGVGAILNALEIYVVANHSNVPTTQDDVKVMNDAKVTLRVNKESWQGDPCIPREFAWDGLNCNYTNAPRIVSLKLSSSNLTGSIASSLSNLEALEVLDLSNNQLTGGIPETLAKLPKLRILNLSGNNLTGAVPEDLQKKVADKTLNLSLDGNPDLCLGSSCPQEKNKKSIVVPVAASVSAFFVVLLCASASIWLIKRKQTAESKIRRSMSFKYGDISRITKTFETVIGEGASGRVYRGELEDTKVAVKVLSKSSEAESSGHPDKPFLAEAKLLTTIHHGNLVSLKGYCDDSKNKALIYEFMANGNLKQHLSGEDVGVTGAKPDVLTWDRRLRIAVDVAQGLNYLHNDCNPSIIHRDIKTTNILLNEDMQAKISDFGLSRALAAPNSSYKSTSPLGTPAYLPPEYKAFAYELNKKSDVYSFGIVLLELISGHPAINTSGEGKSVHILEWAIPKFPTEHITDQEKKEKYIRGLIDPKVGENFDINSAEIVAKVAESCIQTEPGARPDINRVLIELKSASEMASKHKYADGNQEEHIGATSLEVESDSAPLVRAVHSIH